MLFEAVAKLSPEQFTREFGTPPASIRGHCVHLTLVVDRYRARLEGTSVPDISAESIADPAALIAWSQRVRDQMQQYLARLGVEQLDRTVVHATRQGPFTARVDQTLQHVVVHGAYHRGQIACLLKLLEVDFADTDYIIYLNQPAL